jgi:hypothetical protein
MRTDWVLVTAKMEDGSVDECAVNLRHVMMIQKAEEGGTILYWDYGKDGEESYLHVIESFSLLVNDTCHLLGTG